MNDEAAKPETRWTWAIYVAVAAFLVFGANYYTVFDDEALSCRLYAMPLGEMVGALGRGEDPDPPLYYVLQNLWVSVFGVGPFGLRSVSIVLFLAGLVVMRRAGAAWFDERAGNFTLLICAVHPAHLFLGFAGRWYSAMFLLVGMLLWATGRMIRAMQRSTGPAGSESPTPTAPVVRVGWRSSALWGLVAAAVCYTNYFGPVIVGLTWLAMVFATRGRRDALRLCVICGFVAVLAYAPWVPTFWHHVGSFPRFEGGWRSMASSAGRLGLTLVTGNLAGLSAWWSWGPMGVGVLCVAAAMAKSWRRFAPLIFIVAGAIAAGVLSRTLLDKYAMTLSGAVCLLVAGVLGERRKRTGEDSSAAQTAQPRLGRLAMLALVAGWFGCMVNLVTERHWSSLRWLDPFENVTRELYEANWSRSSPDAVCSHPAARYYFALHRANDQNRNPIEKEMLPGWAPPRDGDAFEWADVIRTDAREWLAAWEEQEAIGEGDAFFAKTPTAMVRILEQGDRPLTLTTLETSGFMKLPDWAELRAVLIRRYAPAGEPHEYLEDPEAALKDRIDPAFRHARWRITVTIWRRKGIE